MGWKSLYFFKNFDQRTMFVWLAWNGLQPGSLCLHWLGRLPSFTSSNYNKMNIRHRFNLKSINFNLLISMHDSSPPSFLKSFSFYVSLMVVSLNAVSFFEQKTEKWKNKKQKTERNLWLGMQTLKWVYFLKMVKKSFRSCRCKS